jgi:hypothetical protein
MGKWTLDLNSDCTIKREASSSVETTTVSEDQAKKTTELLLNESTKPVSNMQKNPEVSGAFSLAGFSVGLSCLVTSYLF